MKQDTKGPIAWFARNGVAANLLVLVIVFAGLITVRSIKKEVFPEFSSDTVSITMTYRGAAPEEVEEAVCVRIEEAIYGLDGLKRIRSAAQEGAGTVVVELLPGSDPRKALDDIKSRVDAIDTFPEETEKAVIQEVIVKSQVINVAVSGKADEASLKWWGERVRDEISALPNITQAELVVARPYEISIEVSEETLRRYGLTFDEVARAVRRSSLDLPGGSVKTDGGEYLLRVKGQAYRAPEFEKLPLRTLPDGSRVLLGDVARVVDGFEDVQQYASFNGERAVVVQVFRVGNQNALELSDTIHTYVKEARHRMPKAITLTAYQDYSEYLRGRMNLLLRNAGIGFILVGTILALFMRFRLAFWVSIGIPVTFLGTLWLMPTLDVSINMLSLFAFLIVLGIVVDDAIVVSENIYSHVQQGKSGVQAAIDGCREMAVPVVFAVLTTVAAFAPMGMVEGNTGKVLKAIPFIVIPTLLFSLLESMFVLPYHLSGLRPEDPSMKRGFHPFKWLQHMFSEGLRYFIQRVYRPVLERALQWRYVTIAGGAAILLLSIGLVGAGLLKFQFFPPVEGDDIAVFITMPEGSPPDIVRAAVEQAERAAVELKRELAPEHGEDVFRNVLASVGDQPFRTAVSRNGGRNAQNFARPNAGEVHIQLQPSEVRQVAATRVVDRWRELTGQIPGAVELTFTSSLFSSGNAIDIQLSGPDVEQLRLAADELKGELARYAGVLDIADSHRSGKQEIKLAIKPSAEALGLTLQDLARQVRQAFYGEEAQRIQRGRDDVKVMVRYPEADRETLASLEQMRVRLPDGTAVPFSSVAEARLGRGYSTINRVDRQRAINVTADVDRSKTEPAEVIASLQGKKLFGRRMEEFQAAGEKGVPLAKRLKLLNDTSTGGMLAGLRGRYPGLRFDFEGERREQNETMEGLQRGFLLALFLIFALIGIPLRSYLYPFIVMSAIPFGFVGAVVGHIVMGLHLTVLSMFGLVALAGVAVNDSLVMVDFINRARDRGMPLGEAVRQAGVQRFRPILLTSLTTFAGLMPLILEKSVQAQFLIPMAVSLGFGVMVSTAVTLLLVPANYLIIDDIKKAWRWLYGSGTKPVEPESATLDPAAREEPAPAGK